MKPYDTYKPSGIEWLGEIPQHWDVKRVKDIGFLQNGISKGGEYFGFGFPFVSYSDVYKGQIKSDLIKGLASSTPEDQKLYSVKAGDVFFTRTSETIDEIGIASTAIENIKHATFSGFVIRLRPQRLINKHFSNYFFKAHINRVFLSTEINLVTRASLSQSTLNNLPVLIPQSAEQTAIANYLDTKTAAIDRKIELLTAKADKYKALRRSLINETVCRGLNHNAPMKDSGIEWIGMIPEHWKVKRLKSLGNIETSSVDKKIIEDEAIVKLVNYTDVYGNISKEIWNRDDYMIVSANEKQLKSKRLRQGNVLFTPSSETIQDIGVSAVIMENLENTLYSYHILRFDFSRNIDLLFKKYLLNNDFVQYYFSKSATGTTRKILGLNTFWNLPIILPPLNEQILIGKYLNEKTVLIDTILTNIREQITKLTQLRKTLINDVVTGKIKVTED